MADSWPVRRLHPWRASTGCGGPWHEDTVLRSSTGVRMAVTGFLTWQRSKADLQRGRPGDHVTERTILRSLRRAVKRPARLRSSQVLRALQSHTADLELLPVRLRGNDSRAWKRRQSLHCCRRRTLRDPGGPARPPTGAKRRLRQQGRQRQHRGAPTQARAQASPPACRAADPGTDRHADAVRRATEDIPARSTAVTRRAVASVRPPVGRCH